ncbi:MAG: VOC family protein [Acidimicrobiales bacterium]
MGFITAIDHVQLAIPPGAEAQARQFWVELMGFDALETPLPLAARANRWFGSGAVRLHVGADEDFHPARKAHPALVVSGLDELVHRLERAGTVVRWAEDIGGVRRCHTSDPFGNRIELIEA